MNHIDYRHTEEYYLTQLAYANMETNNNPIQHPEDKQKFYVEKVVEHKPSNGKEYKHITLFNGGKYYICYVFPEFSEYNKLEQGKWIDGYIREYNGYANLVDYCKPESKRLSGETFIIPE